MKGTFNWPSPTTSVFNKCIGDIVCTNVVSLDARVSEEEFKDVFLDDKKTSFLLQACVNHSNVACMELLLKSPCRVDAVELSTGDTALHLACKKDNVEFVVLLVAYGCSTNILNAENMLPEEYAKSKSLKHYFHLLRNQKPLLVASPAQDPLWWQETKGNLHILVSQI
jgi:ankyrin repeat protein